MTRSDIIQSLRSRRSRYSSAAMSLFELTLVLTVAAILTVLFVYSGQYIMLKTRVTRVKEEHRVLSRALQNYEADHGTYPGTRRGLGALNGPVAYMVRIPIDPFSPRDEKEYLYLSSPDQGYRWLIVSRGPDGDCDLLDAITSADGGGAAITLPGDADATLTIPADKLDTILNLMTYDPTNGLRSGGDIITVDR